MLHLYSWGVTGLSMHIQIIQDFIKRVPVCRICVTFIFIDAYYKIRENPIFDRTEFSV